MTQIALFPLNLVLFPEDPLPLRIFETRYFDMVRRCMREGSRIRRGADSRGRGIRDRRYRVYDVGTMANITDFHQLVGWLLGLSCVGRRRFRIVAAAAKRMA